MVGKSADGLSKLTMVVRMKIKPPRNPTYWWGVGVGLWPELNSGYRIVCSNDDCPEVGAVGARWAQWALEVLERRVLHGSAAITELWR